MPQYCLVKHRISTYIIDGADSDRNPDRVPVTGVVTFEALLDKGDSVVVTEDGVATTITLTPIEARITNGEIYHRGEEGVKLFAGGPDTNPEKIRYKATFHNLIAGGKKIELKPILFEAVPGEELTLSMSQPVPGKPYPGYSLNAEEAIEKIYGAVDSAIAPYVVQVDHDKELAQDAAATSIAHAVMAGDAAETSYQYKDLSQDAAVVSVAHAVIAEDIISDALITAHDDVVRIAVDGTGDMVDAVMSPYVDAARHEKELAQDAGAVVATGLALMQDLVNQMNNQ